jgi:hypothetical protein
MGSVSWRKRGNRYLVSWRPDDGSQGGQTVDTPDEARDLTAEKRLEMRRGTWRGRQRGRLPFSTWAAEWWTRGRPTIPAPPPSPPPKAGCGCMSSRGSPTDPSSASARPIFAAGKRN